MRPTLTNVAWRAVQDGIEKMRRLGWRMAQPCRSLLIDVPTSLGKTAAVVLLRLWNRVIMNSNNDQPSTINSWPRHFVYFLPMRTLDILHLSINQTYYE